MGKKVWLIIAAFLVIIGLVIFTAVMMTYNWDFTKLNTEDYQTNTYEINEEFSDISVQTDTSDILFAFASDGICKIECFENENIKYSVSVQNGALTVEKVEDKEWYDYINITSKTPKITIYLPSAQYDTILIEASTGDIRIENMSLNTLNVSLSTGDVVISNTTFANDIKIDQSTGDTRFKAVTCNNIISSASTGDIYFNNVIATHKLSVLRDTGDVYFEESDANEIVIETSTGDIKGSLLSEKIFITETSTGDIQVPKCDKGGKCEITTSTGDIELKIK